VTDRLEGGAAGRTRWRRFAAFTVPAVALAGFIVFGMASGAIAASFAVSGQQFKVAADRLEGDGFVQYGGVVKQKDGTTHPVAVSGIASAELTNLCQSVKVPGMPIVLTINAGGNGKPATADNLMLDVTRLEGYATFTRIEIGRDASTLDKGKSTGAEGSFGQQADHVTITDLRQVAWSTTAGTFTLNGLRMSVDVGAAAKECF
jgi:hypothetical protein